MLAIIIANFVTTRDHLLRATDDRLQSIVNNNASSISEWVTNKKAMVASLALVADVESPLPFVNAILIKGQFGDAYIGYANKKMIITHDLLPEGFDPTTRPWFIQALQAADTITTAPYIDEFTKKLVITIAQSAILKNDEHAVAAADIQLDAVIATVNAIKPTPHSFAFLINGKGDILTHPKAALRLKSVSEIASTLSLQKLQEIDRSQRSIDVHLDGRDGMLMAQKIDGTDWILVVALDRAEALETLDVMLSTSAVVTLLIVLLAVLLLTVLISRMLKYLALVRDAMQDTASGKGDLTK
ncbi:MAG: cache domain-containing protein, partial [Glaciimonas sp.]|nr:cache domain-containing protein [Glaciimonas sp.]